MKIMIMHKHDKRTEAGLHPPPALVAAMGELVGGMAQSGKLLDGAGLGASATRSRITWKRGERSVVHGPFAGSDNELPAGYAMVKVRSRDEAIAWATRIGEAIGGDLELEVGKVNEPWDIGIGEAPPDAPLRYLIVHKATPSSETGERPDLAAVKRQMTDAGVLLTSAELTPSSRARRMTFRGGSRKTVDGPFAESKELIGGYGVLELASMEECLRFCENYAAILLTVSDTLEIDIRPVAAA